MILDSSALLAILLNEPEGPDFLFKLYRSNSVRMSAATYVEASIVVDRRGTPLAQAEFENFFRWAGIRIEPVTVEQAMIARQAFLRFGKGRHPAGLNYGDCFSYALAKSLGEPLLFKGDDFLETDLTPA